MSNLMQEQIESNSTEILGSELELALNPERKAEYNFHCMICYRRHHGVFFCEFCIANELYKRRKTMQFMKLSLTIQAAVCLIGKDSRQPKQVVKDSKLWQGDRVYMDTETFNHGYQLTGESKDEN